MFCRVTNVKCVVKTFDSVSWSYAWTWFSLGCLCDQWRHKNILHFNFFKFWSHHSYHAPKAITIGNLKFRKPFQGVFCEFDQSIVVLIVKHDPLFLTKSNLLFRFSSYLAIFTGLDPSPQYLISQIQVEKSKSEATNQNLDHT